MITILSILFTPDENNYNRFETSFKSIISSDLTNVDKIIIDGWCPSDDIWNNIILLINDNNKITLVRRTINIGKSTIVNDNIANITTSMTQYILLLDSDIILQQDTISRLSLLSSYSDIIIPNQLQDCRHYKLFFKNPTSYNDELIYKITQPLGLAGGCIFASTNVLKDITFKNKGSYGSDDVDFFERAIDKYNLILCENINVTHPFDTNKEYYEWKLSTSLSSFHKELSQEDIDVKIKESHMFWKI